ncbi:serine protease [Aetokthonos hydrillicola Thurmond2011]|jgi:V8-like Glu-specific endopeptidase|uniref:Serine protease n=1 Tax=Aetokthonos hydrillicola Thurmond2011 TaxID=2712845 RepID=A0AAP5IEE4_9CYAN|nr:serine protease [Aetokthonos hydrillicola]MBO3457238.1 trypsin-like peptidase domain-containing protein [Aetokthonos hydrillicola CCALA 1050]MBW4587588.1 serine protease [Aetokthonos hydrillicola CCALA 1050]MDR9900146.1 serine protease [Aetokthonos hydrillicola Thurmond2011]
MDKIPQILGLDSPSLTLYAFHLRNSINQENEASVSEAPRLWEQLEDLGDQLDIPELKSLPQHLICYEDNLYSPEVEDDFGIEYLNLLHNQESSLDFKLSNNEQLDIQGALCPFRLHDTYAIDLTILSQDTFNLHQLSYLNPQNLLSQSQIQANLGQTLLLFVQPLEVQGNYQHLADACIEQILQKNNSIELVSEGKLLGNPIFEYENRHIDAVRQLHILVWFQCQTIEPQHLDKVSELLMYLLWFRHKIFYVYHQSRWCVNQAKKLYNKVENYRQKVRNISQSPNQQIQLRQLRDDLGQIDIEYADYLHYLSEHQKAIGINEKNYSAKLGNLNKLPNNDLIFGQEFLSYISSIQLQIQTDLEFLTPGPDRLRDIKAIIEERISDLAVEIQPENSILYNKDQQLVADSPNPAQYNCNNAIKNNMPGIPREIYPKLKQTLSGCDQFKSHDRLIGFFDANEELKPWCDDLPEAGNKNERAERVISYLVDQYRSDTKENVLLMLLRLLKDQVEPVKQIYQSLSERLQELEPVLSINSSSKPKLVVLPNINDTADSLPKTGTTAEANPKSQPMRFIAADEKLLSCARAVARVSVLKFDNGQQRQIPTGTGWLVTPQLALTCWHVIEARSDNDTPIRASDLTKQIQNTLFTFNDTEPGKGIEYDVVALEHEDVNLDYAVLRLRDREHDPLKKWGFLKLDAEVPLTLQTQLYVVQHPKGLPQQRSGGVFIKSGLASKILHDAPTEPGTSGAPVLNVTNCHVVALHNGENNDEKLREATLIDGILSDLKKNSSNLFNEIIAAQKVDGNEI